MLLDIRTYQYIFYCIVGGCIDQATRAEFIIFCLGLAFHDTQITSLNLNREPDSESLIIYRKIFRIRLTPCGSSINIYAMLVIGWRSKATVRIGLKKIERFEVYF